MPPGRFRGLSLRSDQFVEGQQRRLRGYRGDSGLDPGAHPCRRERVPGRTEVPRRTSRRFKRPRGKTGQPLALATRRRERNLACDRVLAFEPRERIARPFVVAVRSDDRLSRALERGGCLLDRAFASLDLRFQAIECVALRNKQADLDLEAEVILEPPAGEQGERPLGLGTASCAAAVDLLAGCVDPGLEGQIRRALGEAGLIEGGTP